MKTGKNIKFPHQSVEQQKKSKQIIDRATALAKCLTEAFSITDAQLILSYANLLLRRKLLKEGGLNEESYEDSKDDGIPVP